jgi:TPP-dependent pyruvate/acetoin dehydrogenase alpha subunit
MTLANRPSPEELEEIFRRMCLVRELEEALGRLHQRGLTRGPIHRCDGQEAAGVGATMALAPADVVTSTHRGHAHYVGKGVPLGPLVAEIQGKATGTCGGRAGHMLVADAERGLLGGSGIVGGALPVAIGQALAFQIKREPRVVLACFGEGAAQIGACHEAMNTAALWKLPVVFFLEHNAYGLTVPAEAQSSVADLAVRGRAYAIPAETVDGNDAVAVFRAVLAAAGRARAGDGPSLIEAKTYRMAGFSTSDVGGYQPAEELAAWAERDPLRRLADTLLPTLGADRVNALREAAAMEVRAAVEAALAAEPPDAGTLHAPEFVRA